MVRLTSMSLNANPPTRAARVMVRAAGSGRWHWTSAHELSARMRGPHPTFLDAVVAHLQAEELLEGFARAAGRPELRDRDVFLAWVDTLDADEPTDEAEDGSNVAKKSGR
mgnify:CR=1 FL=1